MEMRGDVNEAGLDRGADRLVGDVAEARKVCSRPLVRAVTDRMTGMVERVTVPCGSTRASVCPACAEKAQRLRMQQCSQGWHLVDDPLDEAGQVESNSRDEEELLPSDRRVRSTRRWSDVAELPRVAAEARTVGRTFTAPDGTSYRPSMFVTLTLGSYGRIVAAKPEEHVPGAGTPVNPGTYDYRRAAVEAMFFPRLFDRWVQNLRRCAGYVVQYFGAIEPQRRLAPHIHLALRGAIPRQVIRQVTAATYLQLWWPSFEEVVYSHEDALPRWDPVTENYTDPATGEVLPTWEQALDELDRDPDARPAAVLRFGSQVDIKGIIAPSQDATRSVRYLTKYLTKATAETYTHADRTDVAYEKHIDRLHAELRYLPCAPECANWLRYGVQPKDPGPGMRPGWCPAKHHDREHLGLGGRRVQVSRHWSGKTLRQHRADRAAVVREVLTEAGIDAPATDRLAADILADDGLPRYTWEAVPVDATEYAALVMQSLQQTLRWRRDYDAAKHRLEQQARRGDARASPQSAA